MSSGVSAESPEPGCLDSGLSQTRLLKLIELYSNRTLILRSTFPTNKVRALPPFSLNVLSELPCLNVCQIALRVLNVVFFLVVLVFLNNNPKPLFKMGHSYKEMNTLSLVCFG